MLVSDKRLASICLLAGILAFPLWAIQSPKHSATETPAVADPGTLDNGLYRNVTFGFHYKVPFGWVERTEQMQEDSSDKSCLLLAVFERPPEATGDSVNSAVVITAESVSIYPGLKRAEDYFGPLAEVTTGKGFSVVNQPYYFAVGARQVVREDFKKEIGKLAMYQSSLVILEKSSVVSFMFLAGSQDEVDELIGNLKFDSKTKTSRD
jgi:hypothetical protein